MQESWRRWLRRRTPPTVKRRLQAALYGYDGFTPSFSQAGEDMLVSHILGDTGASGFYVDVGAHHPTSISNTCYFRWLGWRGINLEPQPDLLERFVRDCPNDINLPFAVGATRSKAVLHVPEWGPAGASMGRPSSGSTLATIPVEVRPLADILDEFLPVGQTIDFLNIDVEGAEVEVMESNDWVRFRPRIACIETRSGTRPQVDDCLAANDFTVMAVIRVYGGGVINIIAVDNHRSWESI